MLAGLVIDIKKASWLQVSKVIVNEQFSSPVFSTRVDKEARGGEKERDIKK